MVKEDNYVYTPTNVYVNLFYYFYLHKEKNIYYSIIFTCAVVCLFIRPSLILEISHF